MPTIKKLSKSLIAKIAAGEVIERPAYVVKELVENAIDAQATHISIELQKGGLKQIRVTDNGIGMGREDLKHSFLPNTTSKIRSEDDLMAIHSLGFRGEALYSIASVSQLTIESKTNKSLGGNQVVIEEGTLQHINPFGMPAGTRVTTENLFFNTPVRQKFLKKQRTELKHCIQTVTNLALANPSIGFELSHNNRILIQLPLKQTLQSRASEILGEDTVNHLIPITFNHSYFDISGYLGKPQLASTRAKQFWFVNKRPVKIPLLSSSVKQSLGNLIEPKSQPFFIFYLTIPPQLLDVNLHPRKEEIAFMDTLYIGKLVQKAISKTLENHDLSYGHVEKENNPFYTIPINHRRTESHTHGLLREEITPWNTIKNDFKDSSILQIDNTYLVVPKEKGFWLIDQHAAHERILFNQFKEAYDEKKSQQHTITLKKPVQLSLSLEEKELFIQHKKSLEKLGFTLKKKKQFFEIIAIPKLFSNRKVKQLIKEVLQDIEANHALPDVDSKSHRTLAYLACRSAVMAGDPLSTDDRKNLVEKLLNTENNYTCPHGRPTRIEIKLNDLEKMFKRK